tara:strand:+ start:177 stop:767 length:591 start_codon:yes stop_codon:yes gene_type:complete
MSLIIKIEKIPDDIFKQLKKIANIKKVKANDTLAGNMEEEYYLNEYTSILEKYIIDHAFSYPPLVTNINKTHKAFTENRPLTLSNLWVNHQKKHEFNPIHNHSGVLSFIVFIQIPYLIKDQDKISPGKYSNGNRAGRLAFLEITPTGRIEHKVFDVDKTWEQSVLIFPAELNHIVYPFYKVNKPRITISGNIRYKV